MKQFILLITILIFAGQGSTAQKIRFTDTTNIWHVKRYTMATYPNGSNTTWEYGDTVSIDSLLYYKLNGYLIREDSNKVYVKAVTSSPNIDTTEQVVYNYNLNIGDTIKLTYYLNDTTRHYVNKIDSVLINNIYHRMWDIQPVPGNRLGDYNYTVIEGIGSVKGPLYPLNPVGFEQAYQLFCFKNQNSIITVPNNNAIPNPFGGDYLNPGKCALAVNQITALKSTPVVYPHPANQSSVITLPYNINSGILVVYNGMGQVVSTISINNAAKIDVKALNLQSGLYYYRITYNNSAASWQGKLLYE